MYAQIRLRISNFSFTLINRCDCNNPGEWAVMYMSIKVFNFAYISMIFLLDFRILELFW